MTNFIGHTIGQYQIIEKIGKGGMADVYKAYQPGLDRYVAIKILPEYFLRDETFLARFQREAKAIAKLDHPNILPVYDYGREGDITYIAMKYVEAGTLKEKLGQPLALDTTLDILSQVAGALDHAHRQGVIHRDVKPSNVLMSEGGWALLGDFGLARMVEASVQLTKNGVGVGTPAYMSPEQGQGIAVDARSDVYSLGVVLYEMLTGRVPYEAETPMAIVIKHITAPLPLPREVNPDIPEAVERVVLKALAKDPADRFQSVGEMVEALRKAMAEAAVPAEAVEEKPVEAAPLRPEPEVAPLPLVEPVAVLEEEAVPFWQKVPLWAWGAVGGVVLLIAVAGAFLAGRGEKPGPTPTVVARATTPAATSAATPRSVATLTEAAPAVDVTVEPTTRPSPTSTPLPPTPTHTPEPTPTDTPLPPTPAAPTPEVQATRTVPPTATEVPATPTVLPTATEVPATSTESLANYHSLESYNYPGYYIRHRDFLGELTEVSSNLDRQDSTFRFIPGLADSKCITFESLNYPGYYLRHWDFRIKLHSWEDSQLFREDTTFCERPGLADPDLVSFESYNYPGYYLRHWDFHLYIEQGDSDLFRADVTFRIVEPLGR